MQKGVFYSVGLGPGDPMLMTFKSVEVIKNSHIIAVPKSGATENIALKIAKEHLVNKNIVEYEMPMTKDNEILEKCHDFATSQIEKYLNDGKSVAFLTLGDPTIYSTTMYIHKKLAGKGYETKIISGVPSFCAVAASLNVSLCEKSESLHILPASYEYSKELASLKGNKILMKAGKNLNTLKDKLLKIQSKNEIMMVECASMENEKIHKTLSSADNDASYFSIILIKESESGEKV